MTEQNEIEIRQWAVNRACDVVIAGSTFGGSLPTGKDGQIVAVAEKLLEFVYGYKNDDVKPPSQ